MRLSNAQRRISNAERPHFGVGRCLSAILLIGALRCPVSAQPVAEPTPLAVAQLTRTDPVSFHREILPVLQANCLPCHNRTSAKADLQLESPAGMLNGGESGPAIVPRRSAESLLFKVAAHVLDPSMPPRGNKARAENLTPQQLGLLALWIDQGAPDDAALDAAAVAWQSVPDAFAPALAVALTSDGEFAACGRANRIHVYHVASRSLVARLADPTLPDGAAQRDLVGALAFSPDGSLLASAGYREIRLWRRQDPLPEPFGPAGEPTAVALSPDNTRVALARRNGEIVLLDATQGAVLERLSSLVPAPTLLQFAPDGQRLAGANRQGALRIWSMETNEPDRQLAFTNSLRALVWPRTGTHLVLISEASPSVLLFHVPETPGRPPELDGQLEGHTAPVTDALDAAALGAWLATASEDGTVRLWSTNRSTSPQVFDARTPILRVAITVSSSSDQRPVDSRYLVAAARDGGTRLWRMGTNSAKPTLLRGDLRLASRVRLAEQTKALAQAELDFQKNALQQSTDAWNKGTNTLAKAVEKSESATRTLAESEKKLADLQQTRAGAEKETSESAARLKAATDRHDGAAKAADEARRAVQDAANRLVAAELAAAQALRTRTDLERVLAELPATADEATRTKARETAASAASDVESRTDATTTARTAHTKALDELTARTTTAGEAKAAAEQAKADLPARIQQAEEQSKNIAKSITDLEKQLDRERIQRDTTAADLDLARRTEAATRRDIEDTRRALAAAEVSLARTDQSLRDATAARDTANALGHTWVGAPPLSTRVAAVDATGRFLSWSLADAQPIASSDLPPFAQPVAFLPDGSLLLVRAGGLARLAPFPTWSPAGALGTGGPGSLIVDRVNALAFHPNGQLLASGGGEPSRSGELKLWTVVDRALARDFGAVHSDTVLSVAFSPGGDLLASGGADRFLRLTDLNTGQRVRDFEGHTHHVLAVAWTPDARTLASGGAEGTVKLWNRLTGERLKNVDGFGKEVTALGSLPGSRDFLAVAGSGQARVFRRDGSQVRTLPAGNAFLHSLAIAPDGTFALAGGDDGIVRLWSVPDGRLLADFPLPPAVSPRTVARSGNPR